MCQVFLLIAEANFLRNMDSNPNGPSHAVIKCFTVSYHFAAAPVRYPPTIWNRLIALHLFASAILLYLSSQSFGSSVSVLANSVSRISDSSLSDRFPPALLLLLMLSVALQVGLLVGCYYFLQLVLSPLWLVSFPMRFL